jgi:hypothetical protein
LCRFYAVPNQVPLENRPKIWGSGAEKLQNSLLGGQLPLRD